MKCGDTVKHRPTGETWTVAFVEGENLSWVGWPYGYAKISDCDLVEECSLSEHVALLRRIEVYRPEGGDRRPEMARRALEALAGTFDMSTHRDHFDKMTQEVADAKAETERTYGLWTAATERLRRLEDRKRQAWIDLLEAEIPGLVTSA